MSEGGSGESEPSLPKKVYRTVTPGYGPRPDTEMNVIGYSLFLGMVILLVPLLPFVVIVWVISKLVGAVAQRAPTEEVAEEVTEAWSR